MKAAGQAAADLAAVRRECGESAEGAELPVMRARGPARPVNVAGRRKNWASESVRVLWCSVVVWCCRGVAHPSIRTPGRCDTKALAAITTPQPISHLPSRASNHISLHQFPSSHVFEHSTHLTAQSSNFRQGQTKKIEAGCTWSHCSLLHTHPWPSQSRASVASITLYTHI